VKKTERVKTSRDNTTVSKEGAEKKEEEEEVLQTLE